MKAGLRGKQLSKVEMSPVNRTYVDEILSAENQIKSDPAFTLLSLCCVFVHLSLMVLHCGFPLKPAGSTVLNFTPHESENERVNVKNHLGTSVSFIHWSLRNAQIG